MMTMEVGWGGMVGWLWSAALSETGVSSTGEMDKYVAGVHHAITAEVDVARSLLQVARDKSSSTASTTTGEFVVCIARDLGLFETLNNILCLFDL
jgi:hypothetical protein